MTSAKNPVRIGLAVLAYAVMYYAISSYLFVPLLYWAGGLLVAGTVGLLLSALFDNWLSLRIFENRALPAIGLPLNRAALDNLGFGLLGGFASACLVLVPPVVVGVAHWTRADQPSAGTLPFVTLLLMAGALGEELKFYLMARGIPVKEAEDLLIQAFVGEAVEAIGHDGVREALMAMVVRWLANRS